MDVSLSESSQSDKDLLQAVYNYLLDKIYPKSATKNEKRVIRRKPQDLKSLMVSFTLKRRKRSLRRYYRV